MSYYAVYKGLKPGIYNDWISCKSQINGFSGAKFKKFKNMDQAEYYVKHGLEKIIPKKGLSSRSTDQGTLLIDSSEDDNDDEEETKIIENNTTDNITIYTDGSLIRKNGICWSGYGIYIPGLDQKLSYILDHPKTNNRAELLAIITSLGRCPEGSHLDIYTDSQYSIYICTGTGIKYRKNGYKTRDRKSKQLVDVINRDLIEMVLDILPKYHITFHHIRAHTGHNDQHSRGNDIADTLAVKGSTMDMLQSYKDLSTYPISFGKYSGTPLSEIPESYLQWTQTDIAFEAQCQLDELKRMEQSIIGEYLNS